MEGCKQKVLAEVELFYKKHTEIKESHGMKHVVAVYNHTTNAIACHSPVLSALSSMEIKLAALLHDVDDTKYFPSIPEGTYPNALNILEAAGVCHESCGRILKMIDLVSCSKNGNTVPGYIKESNDYHLLIPRWSDRLEAVGAVGVIRCFQYNQERGLPLSSDQSPRATTVEEVWEYATPERFEAYQATGQSKDMISHYYDKLLHVARPSPDIVQNTYLEKMAEASAKELIEMCLRFGRTGEVDGVYIQQLIVENDKD